MPATLENPATLKIKTREYRLGYIHGRRRYMSCGRLMDTPARKNDYWTGYGSGVIDRQALAGELSAEYIETLR